MSTELGKPAPGWVLPAPQDPERPLRALRMRYATLLGRRIAASPDRSPALFQIGGRLATLFRTHPADAVDVLVDPSVSVLLQCGQVAAALPLIALELGFRGLLGAPVAFESPAYLWSAARNFQLEAAGAAVIISDGAFTVTTPGAAPLELPLSAEVLRTRGGAPFHRLVDGDGPVLALVDANPLSSLEAHPDKSGNAISLGGHEVTEWTASLEEALGLIRTHLPQVYGEMRILLRQILPVGYDEERHLSASYRECVGAIYVTLHPNVLTMAEAILHEFQHNKLNLLAHFDPLLTNGVEALYKSPLRADPRPLMGILLAAHAFVPVAELYRRVRDSGETRRDLTRRLSEVVGKNDEALGVLRAHAATTPLGRAVLDELETIHASHAELPRTAGMSHEG